MKKRKLLALALSCIMAISVMGCSNKAEKEEPVKDVVQNEEEQTDDADETKETDEVQEEKKYDFKGVTVKAYGGIWGHLDSEDVFYIEAKEEVEKKYNIKLVKAEMEGNDGSNTGELLVSSVAAGDPAADIIQVNMDGMITCFTNDILVDVTDIKDTFEIGSVFTDVATWQDKCYGVSYDDIGNAWSLVYDRKLIKDIGMEKTPTEMFKEGKWDYAQFKKYCTEMKSKLPDGVYPIGMNPFRWGLMATAANGSRIIDSNGRLYLKDPAFIEAVKFYQELEEEGLAYPAKKITKADGTTEYDIAADLDDERIVMKLAQPWQFGGIEFEFGVTYWPWGSNVTCTGDYTTLSENYKVANPYWGFDTVVKASIDKTGIPKEVFMEIIKDYQWACSEGDKEWMHDAWVAEQEGKQPAGEDTGEPRHFYTEEDIEIYDWAHSRPQSDYAWTFNTAGLFKCEEMFNQMYCEYLDVRSTTESYYNVSSAHKCTSTLVNSRV